MQLRKIADISHKKPFEKGTLCEYSTEIVSGRAHIK